MRSPPLLLLVSTAALLAASLAHAASPARCDGKHKRPANPYGSVLAAGLKPALASAADAKASATIPAVVTAPTSAKPVAVSRAEPRASMSPCGGAA